MFLLRLFVEFVVPAFNDDALPSVLISGMLDLNTYQRIAAHEFNFPSRHRKAENLALCADIINRHNIRLIVTTTPKTCHALRGDEHAAFAG
ncbi:hypothetical protein D9M68_898980 [compost metagenome]